MIREMTREEKLDLLKRADEVRREFPVRLTLEFMEEKMCANGTDTELMEILEVLNEKEYLNDLQNDLMLAKREEKDNGFRSFKRIQGLEEEIEKQKSYIESLIRKL